MRYTYILLIVLLLGFNLSAQEGKDQESVTPKIDSLTTVLEQSKDTTKVNTLLELADEYKDQDIEKSKKLANEALSLSQKMGFLKGNAKAHRRLGAQYKIQGNWEEALTNFDHAYDIYQEMDNKLFASNQLFNMGVVYELQGNFDKALEYYNVSLNSKKEISDIPGQIIL